MNIYDASKVLGLTGQLSMDIVKKAYRKACSQYHPDRNPGGEEMMKVVNAAYEFFQSHDFSAQSNVNHTQAEYGDNLMSVINALCEVEGLELEICGTWLWITGDTRPHSKLLKECKCKWAPKKKAWYYRPADYKSRGRGKFTLEEIREHHGSQSVATKQRQQIKAA